MGQEESKVYAGVGYTKRDAAQSLENLLRVYVNSKYRVVWYGDEESLDQRRELGVQQHDGIIVPIAYKQDKETGLHSCEVIFENNPAASDEEHGGSQ